MARQLGVTACTVKNWELGHTSPVTRHLPAVIDFLGYQPEGRGQSFSETLRYFRRAAGLSQEQLALRTDFDESTIAKWERGDNLPLPSNLDRLRDFFQTVGQTLPEFQAEVSHGSARRAGVAMGAWRTRHAKR